MVAANGGWPTLAGFARVGEPALGLTPSRTSCRPSGARHISKRLPRAHARGYHLPPAPRARSANSSSIPIAPCSRLFDFLLHNSSTTAISCTGRNPLRMTNFVVKPLFVTNSAQVTESPRDIISQIMSGLPPPICYSESRGHKRLATGGPFPFVADFLCVPLRPLR
jgi:hypothetical protein